ncbi:MAG: OmpH family outer membrane protein [Verrucomicrobia bacterium]|nr:OmpH family outer membrane protein [Verrucomicrobiota bacterium]MDE3099411.1 OmpH family outer membrane protein [Verrucomicrobiota bacterium]
MKLTLKLILPGCLLAALAAQAQVKIATVNLEDVFTNYYKYDLAQQDINNLKNQIEQDEATMVQTLKEGNADYQKLEDAADNQALSDTERQKNSKAADAKLKELQQTRSALQDYDTSAKARLEDQSTRMRANLIKEIQTAVVSVAKGQGDTLVLDSAAQTVNATPMLLFSAGKDDLTQAVIARLNAGAPIGLNVTNSIPPPTPTVVRTNIF